MDYKIKKQNGSVVVQHLDGFKMVFPAEKKRKPKK